MTARRPAEVPRALPSYPPGAVWPMLGLFGSCMLFVWGNDLLSVGELIAPGFQAKGRPWMWRVAAVPYAVGLMAANLAVIRYPYLSLAEDYSVREFNTGSCLWKLLGYPMWLFGAWAGLIAVACAGNGEAESAAACGGIAYLLVTFGWLFARYHPTKHPTVATLLAITGPLGPVLFPLYLPAVWVGSYRLRRALRGG